MHEDDTAIPVEPGSKHARVSTDTLASRRRPDRRRGFERSGEDRRGGREGAAAALQYIKEAQGRQRDHDAEGGDPKRTKAKRGRPKEKEDDHEEAARYQKDGGKVLGEKWVGLCVRDDEYRFAGEIVGMKWVDDTDPPQICAEIRSYDKKVTETYCVYDLPAMVIAAEDEQLLDVLLEYDPPEDEFDLLGDEEAERTMAQPLGPDDDDGAEDDDVDLEL